jgi:hypothetical protein
LLLRRITAHPLRSSFSRISPFARRSVDERISRAPMDLLHLSGAATQFDDLLKSGERPEVAGLLASSGLDSLRKKVAEKRRLALSSAAGRHVAKASADLAELGHSVLEAAQTTMTLLDRVYAGEPVCREGAPVGSTPPAVKKPESGDDASAQGPKAREYVDDAFGPVAWRYAPVELGWLREAEEFVATVVTLVVNRHVRQFNHFLYGLTASILLILAAFGSYSFEPHRLLLTCLWGVTGTVVLSGLYVFIGLDRNTLLSLVAGTAPGKMTLDSALATRLVTWVGVPLLGMAAAEYPVVANALAGVLEPLLNIVR